MASGIENAGALAGVVSSLGAVFANAKTRASELDAQVEKLGRTLGKEHAQVKALELRAKGLKQVGEAMEEWGAAIGYAAKLQKGLAAATKAGAEFDSVVAGIWRHTDKADGKQKTDIASNLKAAASTAGVDSTELGQSVSRLIGPQLGASQALALAPLIAQFSVGQEVAIGDTEKLVMALNRTAGLKTDTELRAALNTVIGLSKQRGVEPSLVVKEYPQLLAALKEFDVTGADAVNRVAALMEQEMAKGASAEDAAKEVAKTLDKLQGKDKKDNDGKQDGKEDKQSSKETPADKAKKEAEQAKAARLELDKLAPPAARAPASGDATTKDFNDKNEDSRQQWKRAETAMGNVVTDVGTAIKPATDLAAQALTGLAHLVSGAVSTRLGAAAATFLVGAGSLAVGAALALSAGKYVMGAGSTLKGWWQGRKFSEPADGAGGTDGTGVGGGKRRTGPVQRVYVTNWHDQGSGGNGAGSSGGKKNKGGKNRGGGGSGGSGGRSPALPARGRAARVVGKAWDVVRGAGVRLGAAMGVPLAAARAATFAGRMAPVAAKLGGGALAVAGAAYQVYDTYKNANTTAGKAEGYGQAAGAVAGGLAGAKLGAAIGLVAGPIGAAVGGLLGGGIGAAMGQFALGSAAKSLFSGRGNTAMGGSPAAIAPAAAATAATVTIAAAANAAAAKPPSAPLPVVKPVPQQVSFNASIAVSVHGDVREPRQLANELVPHLRKLFDEYRSQQQRSGLFDTVTMGVQA